ncbi:DNA-binding transcriptional regulator, LysR family [Quadrisphaera granulorum]|uniref:DNA-binding transcriptional LysR family regulator n=1 Tax=Quadrisphaera granulorum TaxID=317664 RepID=A0A316ACG6_9ACTN|nr:LysR family transcriptional regulator [Quadrisphaera granulorum]PWJ54660.1 DNA-binding transcriptional LysR family regulator [Quadrisphaera granulorum]SZE96022.1 DNA-binding transcriptional regulator, LysR family [Quadrisphaera granulorum]
MADDVAWELRHLRCFLAVVDEGTFTDAAIALGTSQAAVSRTVAALEQAMGARLLTRQRAGARPTSAGAALVVPARRLLTDAQRLQAAVAAQSSTLRLGYAWAALGEHTTPLLRGWAREHPQVELVLVRHNSPTGGLAEGLCDAAVVRTAVDERRWACAVVGLERRLVAFAADDAAWARRRSLRMADVAERTVLVDARTGTTSLDLWPPGGGPARTLPAGDVEEWLDTIAAGRAVGTTAQATAVHNPRPGVLYRPINDGPPITVRLIWDRDDPPPAVEALVATISALYAR